MAKWLKLINGRWHVRRHYYEIQPSGKRVRKFLSKTLNAKEEDYGAAMIEFGRILENLDKGVHPNALKTVVGRLNYHADNTDKQALWENNIKPFFHDYRVQEVDEALIKRYIRTKWEQAGDEGELRSKKSSLKKRLRVLREAIHLVHPLWQVPVVKTREIPMEKKQPLVIEAAKSAAPFVKAASEKNGDKYLLAHWIMLYTAMDISDAIALAAEHIVPFEIEGKKYKWISMERAKSGVKIELPLVAPLDRILSRAPRPIDSKTPYCHGILLKDGTVAPPGKAAKNVATAVRRGFRLSGKAGYSSKDLRRMLGAVLLDLGYSRELIRKALTHAPGSRSTDAYMGVYDASLNEALQNAFG